MRCHPALAVFAKNYLMIAPILQYVIILFAIGVRFHPALADFAENYLMIAPILQYVDLHKGLCVCKILGIYLAK